MKEVIVNAEDLVCLNKEKLQELIRCKDCKFYSDFLGANPNYHLCERFDAYRKADEFCSRAERKEE